MSEDAADVALELAKKALAHETVPMVNIVGTKKTLAKFVTVEGLDGCGKTTLVNRLVSYLQENEISYARLSMVPAGEIRNAILHDHSLSPTQRLVLLLTAAESVRQQVEDNLREGHFVLCDRGYDSFLAYQAFGENLDTTIADLARIELYPEFPTPDLTFYLRAPVETCLARMTARHVSGEVFESKGKDFYDRVYEGYESLAHADQDRIYVLDATASPGIVSLHATTRLGWMIEG